MATITEDYVSFETAKLLKEKEFPQNPHICNTAYTLRGKLSNNAKSFVHNFTEFNKCGIKPITYSMAPTIQMAMKWLREVHKIVITVSILNENNKGNTDYSNPDRWFYFFDITNEKGVVIDIEYDPLSNEFLTYEEACEAAIKYCLENLI